MFSDSTSLIWKDTKVIRMYDAKRNTLVYVAISKRVIEGSPMNAISAVPVAKWEAASLAEAVRGTAALP